MAKLGNRGSRPGRRALTASVVLVGVGLAAACCAQTIEFATGPKAADSGRVGEAVAKIWQQSIPGLEMKVRPGNEADNLRDVEAGRTQVAVSFSPATYDAHRGRDPFVRPTTQACHLANLYFSALQVAAVPEAGVRSYADLSGKVLVTGPKGSSHHFFTGQVLRVNGLTDDSLAFLRFQDWSASAHAKWRDSSTQVMSLNSAYVALPMKDFTAARGARLIAVDEQTIARLRVANPGYNRLVLSKHVYPNQDRDVAVAAYSVHLVARCDVSERLAYQLTRSLADNLDTIGKMIVPIAPLSVATMALDVGVTVHPGAARYYRERLTDMATASAASDAPVRASPSQHATEARLGGNAQADSTRAAADAEDAGQRQRLERVTRQLASIDQREMRCTDRCVATVDRCYEQVRRRALADLGAQVARGGTRSGYDGQSASDACTERQQDCESSCKEQADAEREAAENEAPLGSPNPVAPTRSAASPGGSQTMVGQCGDCASRAQSHLAHCKAGSQSDCYRAAASVCQCQIDLGGCGIQPTVLRQCVDNNNAQADALRSDGASTYGSRPSTRPPVYAPPPKANPPVDEPFCGWVVAGSVNHCGMKATRAECDEFAAIAFRGSKSCEHRCFPRNPRGNVGVGC